MSFATEFDRDTKSIPFNNAGLSLMSRAATKVIHQATLAASSSAFADLDYWIAQYANAHKTFETLVGCEKDTLAFMPNVCAGLSQAAFGLPLEKGDEILSYEGEYPSNTYPWIAAAKKRSATCIQVPFEKGNFSEDALIARITAQTKVVSVSWVQFQNGYQTNLAKLSAACKKVGAFLVVDAIQGLGMLPFNMQELGIDVLCGGTYKWLSGPIGLGFMAMRSELIPTMQPLVHGALCYSDYNELVTDSKRPPHADYRRFEPGAPHLMLAPAAAASVERILSYGVENVNKEALAVSDYLISKIETQGLELLSSKSNPQRSPIVCFKPKDSLEHSSEKLNQAGISHAVRMGGLRISPHVYNTSQDVDLLLKTLG